MKNISLILNIVLFVAVAGLYFIQFSGNKEAAKTVETPSAGNIATAPSGSVAYVNVDSLFTNYAFFNDIRNSMATSQQALEKEFQRKGVAFEKKAIDFQEKVQKRLITTRQAEETQQKLQKEQEDLQRLQQEMSMQLMQQEQNMNRDLYDSIYSYLNSVKEKHGYQYVLGFTSGGGILFADDKFDITDAVVDGLNARYEVKE